MWLLGQRMRWEVIRMEGESCQNEVVEARIEWTKSVDSAECLIFFRPLSPYRI